jgi:proteasome assembly chaperone (PAC2) family protein
MDYAGRLTMWQNLQVHEKIKLTHDPALLVSVSTSNPQYQLLYSQARELGGFLRKKLKPKLIASMYSSAMPPSVVVREDGIADLVSTDFYHHFTGERDIVLMDGFGSPVAHEYEFSREVYAYVKTLGIKEIVSIGARWTEEPISPLDSPKVLGFASDADGVKKLSGTGVEILREEPALYFANLIVAMAPLFDMKGYKLSVNHGEPKPHPKSLMAFIGVLGKLLGLKVDTSELEGEAKELAQVIKSNPDGHALEGGEGEEGKDIYR